MMFVGPLQERGPRQWLPGRGREGDPAVVSG